MWQRRIPPGRRVLCDRVSLVLGRELLVFREHADVLRRRDRLACPDRLSLLIAQSGHADPILPQEPPGPTR